MKGTKDLKILMYGQDFNLLMAFHIAWREPNIGAWITLKKMGYGNRTKFAKYFGLNGDDESSKRNKSIVDVVKKIFE